MNISRIVSLEQIKNFLKASSDLNIDTGSGKEIYAWLQKLLLMIKYRRLGKKDKGTVKIFIKKVTGYCDKQIKRLLKKHKDGTLRWEKWQKGCFSAVYDQIDVGLLHEVDKAHKLSGPATRAILKREYEVFGKKEFRKLANISSSHIYNIRKRISYLRKGKIFDETKSTFISIGKRMKPRPEGRPGFLRVDTVHQGDKDNKKGIYHINIVDEITQSEFIFSVPAISELYLKDVLWDLNTICPFVIKNFHSDNGSEFINQVVAGILNELHINQTKSRPRKHNDNGLVETKNGWIIRKTYGYFHIPATEENANLLNGFNRRWLNVYLNYHRTCGFATTTIDGKGKEKKVYKTYLTPYEKLKSLPHAELYLKRHVFFEDLDKIAYAMSDTEFATKMNEEKEKMFQRLRL